MEGIILMWGRNRSIINNSPPAWLYRRPRVLNLLHSLGIANPHSQMNQIEKDGLRKYATGKKNALEIGTYMGVTASIIAMSLDEKGELICVDPFESKNNKQNPGLVMATRELNRHHVFHKTKFLLGFSNNREIINKIPERLDFILVDGDHSYKGLENDWQIVLSKLDNNGIVCLHDTTIPEKEPYRDFGSVAYFNDVIKYDTEFVFLETVYSMNILRKK